MKEILLAILIPQILLIPIYFAIRKGGKRDVEKEGGGSMVDTEKVFTIIKECFLDLKRQHASGFGPWLSTFLDGGDLFISGYSNRGRPIVDVVRREIDPSAALIAVQWTIRDLQNLPIGDGVEYVKGVGFRFNLDVLLRAEEELMGMCA